MVPVPGYGPGRLDVEGNLAHYIDRIVLGHHNYLSAKTWDPEGIVSTLPANRNGSIRRTGRADTPDEEQPDRAHSGVILHWNACLPRAWCATFGCPSTRSFGQARLRFSWRDSRLSCLRCLSTWWTISGTGASFKPFVIMGVNAIAVLYAFGVVAISLDALRAS